MVEALCFGSLYTQIRNKLVCPLVRKSQGNLFFLQGQGKVREFCKMAREIRKSLKVSEKSGNFKIVFVLTAQKLN